MRIYIAYKYRNVPDKKTLIDNLEKISIKLKELGHTPFILGRDVQKWALHGYSKISTTVEIFKNIRNQDMVFVYVNSPVHTNGIPVEITLAKLMGHKVISTVQKGIKPMLLDKISNKFTYFEDIDDLLKKIPDLLK